MFSSVDFPFYYLLAAIMTLSLGIYTIKYKDNPGVTPFIWLMFLSFVLSIANIYEVINRDLEIKIVWRNIQQIPLFLSPVVTYALVIEYIGRENYATAKRLFILGIPAILFILFIFTDQYHHLMRLHVFVAEYGNYSKLTVQSTSLANLFIYYNLFLSLFSIFTLLLNARNVSPYYKKQHLILLLGLSLPILNVAFQYFFDIYFSEIVSTFIPSALLIFYGLLRHKLFDIWPIARDKIIENMKEGIIVLDKNNIVIDLNLPSIEILRKLGNINLNCFAGESIHYFLKKDSQLMQAYLERREQEFEVEINGENKEYYLVKIVPLKDSKDKHIATLSIFSDITENKNYQKELLLKATVDGLTGLYNRNYFIELAEKELDMKDHDRYISLIFLDIDNFKRVNDTYGHLVGDLVLKEFAATIAKIVGDRGIIGRIGGEEFAIILPNRNETESYNIAEEIRKQVEDNKIGISENEQINYTVSIGITSTNSSVANFQNLYKFADLALYQSKTTGKNKTSLKELENKN